VTNAKAEALFDKQRIRYEREPSWIEKSKLSPSPIAPCRPPLSGVTLTLIGELAAGPGS
jgi:hypothetical protein